MTAGQSMHAERYAKVHGICVDKTAVLERQLAVAIANRAQLAQQTAEQVAAVLSQTIEALGINDLPARELVAGLLRQAGAGEPIVADHALAEQARCAQRERIADEIRETIEAELAARPDVPREQLALPAPAGPHPDGRDTDERTPMAGPVRRVRASRERRRKRERVETVTGEVVDESRWRPTGQASVEDAATRDPEAAIHWNDDLWHNDDGRR
jgi:hypothetical protein